MRETVTGRGFELVEFDDNNCMACSLQQSSGIGNYPDALDRPGTSYVWLGETQASRMHLNRETVAELVQRLQGWLATGSIHLPKGGSDAPAPGKARQKKRR